MPETMGTMGSTQGVKASAMPSRKNSGPLQARVRSPINWVIRLSLASAASNSDAFAEAVAGADSTVSAEVFMAAAPTAILRVCGG